MTVGIEKQNRDGGSNLQVAGRGLQVIVSPIQKVSQTFIKANLRPKNFCLGPIRPKVGFYECLGYFLYW